MEVLISLPGYTQSLMEEMEKHDFLVHSFPLDQNQSIYSPGDYLYNQSLKNLKYELVVDTNIFHFLLRATEGINNQKTRSAVGLVAFCQLAKINIEPSMAVYELIDYEENKAEEAVEKVLLFDQIDNANNQQLAEFCLGKTDSFELPSIPERDKTELKASLTKYRRLTEWDSVYLIMLAIIHIDQSDTPRDKKLLEFTMWMYEKFHLSVAATSFCTFYFGKKPIKKMMKYKASDTVEKRRKSITNMTWDLYIITQYFRKWVGNKSNKEYIYASDDRAFRDICRLGIDIQVAKGISPLKQHLKPNVFKEINELNDSGVPEDDRAYHLSEDPHGYRALLISEFESLLGISEKS